MKITNKIGFECSEDSCIYINNIIPFYGLWVPNAIYPDNSNKEYTSFLPKGKGIKYDSISGQGEYRLSIYDKFGGLIFTSNKIDPSDGSPLEGWDGTKDGIPLPQGTYVWKIYAQFNDGTFWKGTGTEFGEATNGNEDPWKKRNQIGLKVGTLYLVR